MTQKILASSAMSVAALLLSQPAHADPTHGGRVYIYDASVSPLPMRQFKGIMVLHNEGVPTLEIRTLSLLAGRQLLSPDAAALHGNIGLVQEFYSKVMGREGYDGNRAEVHASVNVSREFALDIFGLRRNAAWMGSENLFIFGHGEGDFKSFAGSLDVVAHEFTHAVIDRTSRLMYQGQSGALNEHFADVMGASVRQYVEPGYPDPFLIGDTVITDAAKARESIRALRDMENPDKGFRKQPGHVSEIPADLGVDCVPSRDNDQCGVHILSGIPNRAATTIIKALGWEASRQLFYKVMASLKANATFKDYRVALESEPLPPAARAAVTRAMDEVGISR